jgi:NDP-sugar pyrophosphorylase family protein
MKSYRNLTKEEVDTLLQQNCTCENWEDVEVREGFDARHVRNTTFTGKIKLGVFNKIYTLEGNIRRHSGITNATLHNCIIGDNVYIGKINGYIANYSIGDDTYIENVDLLTVTGKSTFGNGISLATLNEGGGREVPLCDKLSAHIAYMIALYRHRPEMIRNLENLIHAYSDTIASDMGTIGRNVSICNCRTIKNIRIGDYAILEGCSELINGSINSNKEAPVYFGISVIAHDFIASSGSEITEGALIDRCFIGQACEIRKQYSATDSLFFANCQLFHGEAASIFAGPFTVTHHKSTLLIAGMFSFFNAGSGSNQSNHLYKLGPVHQGIVERGSKTTSDSYMLWPVKIGAFSLVKGHHTAHSDTSDLPFSYLIENNNETVLVPAANLKSVGTIRDARKWSKRDKRRDPDKQDQINFNLLSPYTIQKMIAGQKILNACKNFSEEPRETYYYQNTRINNSSLHKGIYLYEMGIYKFLGNSLIKRLEGTVFGSIDEIRERLKPDNTQGLGEWVDMAGLITPKSIVEKLIARVENNVVESIEQLNNEFVKIHSDYDSLEWTWTIDKIQEKLGKTIAKITVKDIMELVEKWKHAVVTLDEMLYEDAKKEFTSEVKTGFGVDGDDTDRQKDFESVRGDFDKHPFVLEVKNHISIKTALGDELIARIKNLES